MRRSWITFVLGGLAPLAGLAAEPGYLRLRRVEIVDKQIRVKGTPAKSVLCAEDR